jgi:putative NADH-flavin reductase
VKTALLFGASGLVGSHLLNQLIKDTNYSKIKLFVRSVPEISDPKVQIIKTDFNNLENQKEDIKGDDCFFVLVQQNKIHLIKMNIEGLNLIFLKKLQKLQNQIWLIHLFLYLHYMQIPRAQGTM